MNQGSWNFLSVAAIYHAVGERIDGMTVVKGVDVVLGMGIPVDAANNSWTLQKRERKQAVKEGTNVG